jgi:hypothetical protein
LTCPVNDVIYAVHDEGVAVFIEITTVTRNLTTRFNDIFEETLVVLPKGRQASGRTWKFNGQWPLFSFGEFLALGVQYPDVIA